MRRFLLRARGRAQHHGRQRAPQQTAKSVCKSGHKSGKMSWLAMGALSVACALAFIGLAPSQGFASAGLAGPSFAAAPSFVAATRDSGVVKVHNKRKYHCHKRTERTCYTVRERGQRRRICGPTTVENCHQSARIRHSNRRVRVYETSS